MKTFKLVWNIHKYVGLVLAIIVAMISVTGFLLIIKKDVAALQPPTMRGEAGEPDEFLSIAEVLDRCYAVGHPAFAGPDDIDRIDFRLGKRVHKVRSKHDTMEIQVDAVTGAILSGPLPRRSDLIEQIHDGSFFGDAVHGWVMPATAVGLLVLTVSGIWVWVAPILKRRQRRAAARATASAPAADARPRQMP
jgi:uncharacterized iron-regulated membrane protein